MKWYRIWALVIRHLTQFPTDFNKLASVVFWPLLDILLFGFAGAWLGTNSVGLIENRYILLTGVVFWQLVSRTSLGVSLNLLEEIWAQNITNLFSSPLTIYEWVTSTIIEGIILFVITLLFCASLALGIHKFNVFILGWWLIPLLTIMFITGLFIGLISTSILILKGSRFQSLPWMLPWAFGIISGAFYPITILPQWLQITAKSFPLYYTFTGMQQLMITGIAPSALILKGLLLSIIYFILGLYLFVIMFNKSKQRGLTRITG